MNREVHVRSCEGGGETPPVYLALCRSSYSVVDMMESASWTKSAALLAALLILAACGVGGGTAASSPEPSAPAAASSTQSQAVPAGWNAYVDPDFGWFTGYPPGWIVLSGANTPLWKNFITDDPKVDVKQRSFRIQPGDGLLTVSLDQPAECSQENLGENSSTVMIDGHQAPLYHRNPPSSTGGTASEYVLQILANGRCYSIYLLFISVAVETATTVVQGVVTSFRFAE
jgi:hypothetical protein